MRKALSVSALILALTCPIHAGDMQNDSPTPPPAPAVQEPADDATPGDISTPDVTEILTETALDLLAVLPSLI